ncbi:MAG: XTP/dITP diphosphatase [Lentisphaerae bacterium]|nr:XTP/dITP diphosphatase [Lentisphaerota bacterium]
MPRHGVTVLVATQNPHKLREIRAILSVPGLTIAGAEAYPGLPEVEEDGTTFEANAVKKAESAVAAAGVWALADDSGLEVAALDGVPGVRSARYAGEPVDYAANNAKLLRELEGVTDRRARFRCVMALAQPGRAARTVEGRCEGHITTAARGTGGFGYDPVFIPEGENRTFAEMTAEEKNGRSHRAAALARMRGLLAACLAEPG